MSTDTPETPVAATPPTPENVAEMLTSGDNDYHDGNYWKPSLSASGNVVKIGIEPFAADEDGTRLPKVHFRAVVVQVPAYAVADKPVKLPADLARDLAYGDPGDSAEGYTVVANEHIDKRRWESVHRLVIRNERGEHFMDTYRRGLTEYQDSGPYEGEGQATFVPVEPHFKAVTAWTPAKDGGAA